MPRSVALLLLAAAFALACASTGRGGGKADAARGQKYYAMKCNACHPNGGAGAGPALFGSGHNPPGPLMKSSAGGRHNVPEAEFDSLVLYLQGAMAAPASAPTGAPTTAPTTAPTAAPTTAPMSGATKMCACTCQCPADTPPGQMANCQCQCQCP